MKLTRIVIRILGLSLAMATLGAIAGPPPTTPPGPSLNAMLSTVIPCEDSPFGEGAPVVQDLEPLLLLWRDSNYNSITEFRLPNDEDTKPTSALYPVYSDDLFQAPLVPATFRKAVSADLDGNGRDEIVAVFSDGSALRVAVYSRTGDPEPDAPLIDTWTYTAQVDVNTIDIAAGDFDGSTDQQQEIALSWNGPSLSHLLVLKGDSSGHIATPDGSPSGLYNIPEKLLLPRIAVGDFLLAGREQMVLAGYGHAFSNPTTFMLHLAGFDDGSNPGSVTVALPVVGSSMRSKRFLNNFQGPVADPYFAFDDGSIVALDNITEMDADAGDLVDTAAAELVLHLLFNGHPGGANARPYLAARLLHFVTFPDPQTNEIVVELAGGQTSYDSSIEVPLSGQAASISPGGGIDATVAEVDGLPGEEIVTAWASKQPGSWPLAWSVHQARLQLVPGFQYKNQGMQNGRPVVKFLNKSRGSIARYTWDFDDGSDNQGQISSPTYVYESTGIYVVTLTIDGYDGTSKQVSYGVEVTGATDESAQGHPPPLGTYRIDSEEEFGGFSDEEYAGSQSDPSDLRVAAADMNHDSLREIVIAKKVDTFVDMHVLERRNAGAFWPPEVYEYSSSMPAGVIRMDMLLGDFDGDSIKGVLSSAEGDCRFVEDDLIRSLTWVPPYFSYLQGNTPRRARYGTTTDTTEANGTSSSSYISSDTTITLGLGFEFSVPIVGSVAEATVKGKAGYVHQSNTGEQHTDAERYTVDQAAFNSNEGLLRRLEATSSCYTYRLVTASGVVPNSNMRMCEHEPADEIQKSGGVVDWNQLASVDLPIQIPSVWVPLQRDWASVALFHAPTSGSSDNNLQWLLGSGPGKATDGKFTTAAESQDTATQPYLEIDLGSVQQISSVRVFPKLDEDTSGVYKPISFRQSVGDLAGFRLYVSATPFASGELLPTNAIYTVVNQDGISTFVQDMKGDQSTQVWNVWTGDPADGMLLFGRYIRLQKPETGKIAISEIQVFGDTHAEPPDFPEAVCDSFVGDGLFHAWVYNDVDRLMTKIELRGDMVWSGATNDGETGVPSDGSTYCMNDPQDEFEDEPPFPQPLPGTPAKHASVQQVEIWKGQFIWSGATTTTSWNLAGHTASTDGTVYTASNGVHLGAEFEAKAGPYVKLIGGVAQKVSFGWGSGSQSSVTYGNGFSVGGSVSGFNDPRAGDDCGYFPRPYTYQVTNISNLGTEHSIYVTDYVVQQVHNVERNVWQRGSVPLRCFTDSIFADGFD